MANLGTAPGKQPDPAEIRTRRQFASALTFLRERAGLTVRDVAKLTGIPSATLGGYYSGRHLPPARAVEDITTILQACGVNDERLLESWQHTLIRLRRQNSKSGE